MVSLVNFKTVGEELQRPTLAADGDQSRPSPQDSDVNSGENDSRTASRPHRAPVGSDRHQRAANGLRNSHKRDPMDYPKHQRTSSQALASIQMQMISTVDDTRKPTTNNGQLIAAVTGQQQTKHQQMASSLAVLNKPASLQHQHQHQYRATSQQHPPTHEPAVGDMEPQQVANSFTVTWRNLRFAIEPKWHEKLAGGSSRLGRLASRLARPTSSASSWPQKPTTPALGPAAISAPRAVVPPAGGMVCRANNDGSAGRTRMGDAPPPPATSAQDHGVGASGNSDTGNGGANTNISMHDIAENDGWDTGEGHLQEASSMTRVVLDRLDGSFRSGELTAILGPSGAGKTTLLDCLTGHRKHGLTGSIRISADSARLAPAPGARHGADMLATGLSASSAMVAEAGQCQACPGADIECLRLAKAPAQGGQMQRCYAPGPANISPTHQTNQQRPLHVSQASGPQSTGACCGRLCFCGSGCGSAAAERPPRGASKSLNATNGDNLKVSIIPQNDHLMGHLTVYETLNYASKMKNCFDANFDHKLNIRRVAQQLGLISCLATRVNKLSGGQYKRVSIAQELLSSPDILILDEPTSGLDAMTCYQTVQVLKRLTDEHEPGSGEKQIAVILTIHQPNSDVFQQFDNVYVVAQGGKCIYEGPPGGIESIINRIGIHLPNTYYNPATMIVEIAAGKFGLEAVHQLNAIQRKQYEPIGNGSIDEQNSTGDSAVDCPSTSNDEDEDDDQQQQHHNHHHHKHDDSALSCCNNNNNIIIGNNNRAHDAAVGGINGKTRCNCRAGDKCNDGNAPPDHHPHPGDHHHHHPMIAQEINNNNAAIGEPAIDCTDGRGLINKGFVIGDDILDTIKMSNGGEHFENPVGLLDGCANQVKNSAARNESFGCSDLSLSHVDSSASNVINHKQQQQPRKRRRRARKRTLGDSDPTGAGSVAAVGGAAGRKRLANTAAGPGPDDDPPSQNEKRLKLNSLKADQKFPFWRHTYLHFHRSWLSIVRDPMLCSMQLALHIIVPVMVSLVYGTNVGRPNACPRAGPVDIMAYALEPTDTALQLQEDLRTTLENIGYIFFKLYGIIFAAMTVTVLTFPLDMHVLVKEFRNGWYGLSSYFLGRTLADIPFQLTLPLLAMSLSYYATGQPSSYFQWRFLSITAILILSSLIAQSQGLLFGAILMDRMKAAVFVAPAATTPIILFAGFLVRNQSIPRYLRPLSSLSYLRYAIEACLISRYGFNQCECDPAIFNQTVPELPPIARSMLDYWLSSFRPPTSTGNEQLDQSSAATLHNGTSSLEATTLASEQVLESAERPDLFTKLIHSLAKANSFGRNITSCEQVVPYPMIDYDLKDAQLFDCFAILLGMLIFTRLLTFFIVCFKVKRKV